ncbi:hypothetical protein LTS15_008169 [Exophiala xenobiotica]|nr:hypothetical protein LTS15_008169 [Exophiala xenobiotica]
MYWECQRHCVSENGSTLGDGLRIGSFASIPRGTGTGTSGATFKEILRHWWNTVSDYAQRDLFAASDKLPALAGLASRFHRLTGATYMAGLWLEDFPMALLWNTVVGRFTETGHSVEQWKAPSWFWASIEGALNCIGYRILLSKESTLVEQLEILSFDVALTRTECPLGEVANAKLRVRGKLQRASRGLEKQQYDYGGFKWNIELGYPVKLKGGDSEGGSEVGFDNESVEGPGTGTFKRIGTGQAHGRSCFESCEIITLDLI